MKFIIPVEVEANSPEAALVVRNYVETAIGTGFNANEFDDVAYAHTGDPDEIEGEDQAAFIELAREQYARGSDDDIEVYDNARISSAGDDGMWVEAWLYLSQSSLEEAGLVGAEEPAAVVDAADSEGGHCD